MAPAPSSLLLLSLLPAAALLPPWPSTYDVAASTLVMPCNSSGLLSTELTRAWGLVSYDWSNAKALWANAHPMSSEELITTQAEMVYAQDPGLPGYAPRVWAYRNTIKVRGRESSACAAHATRTT